MLEIIFGKAATILCFGGEERAVAAKHGAKQFSQLGCILWIWLQQTTEELWWQAIAQYALSEEPDCADVDPSTEGLHQKEIS